MGETFLFVVLMAVGYLAGSVCSAVIVCRIFGLPDPRTEGSNNPGATNVLRIAGKEYAAVVLVADMLKGLLPVLLAKLLGAGPETVAFTCLAAVIGHMWPVFFGFHGGKGVATALGGMLGINLVLGAMVIATWLLVANFSRRSSLASLVSMALMPLFSLMVLRHVGTFPPLFIITVFVFYKHRNNITRLIDGTEPRIGTEKDASQQEE